MLIKRVFKTFRIFFLLLFVLLLIILGGKYLWKGQELRPKHEPHTQINSSIPEVIKEPTNNEASKQENEEDEE